MLKRPHFTITPADISILFLHVSLCQAYCAPICSLLPSASQGNIQKLQVSIILADQATRRRITSFLGDLTPGNGIL